MNPQSNIEKIKQVLKEINDARESLINEVLLHKDAYSLDLFPNSEVIDKLSSIDSISAKMGRHMCDCFLQYIDKHFQTDKITSLTKALEVAVEAIEEYSDLHYAPKLIEALEQVATIVDGSEDE